MKQVLLALFQGVELFEAAAFYDILGWSGEYGSEAVRVTCGGFRREPVATFGMRLCPDIDLRTARVEDFDALAVPGGFGTHGYYEEAFSAEAGELIRAFAAADKPVASICVGALALGKSGILRGRRATTYAHRGGERRRQLSDFGARLVEDNLVIDGKFITSSGPSAAADSAFALLHLLTGAENENLLRRLMGFPERAGA